MRNIVDPEYGPTLLGFDARQCQTCGYVATHRQLRAYIGHDHPFHYSSCEWKERWLRERAVLGESEG